MTSPVMVLGRQSQELLRGFLLALLRDAELLGTVVCSHRCPLAPRGTWWHTFLAVRGYVARSTRGCACFLALAESCFFLFSC